MDESIIFKMQELIRQYKKENINLWIDIYEDFLQYSITILDVTNSGITMVQRYTINIPFTIIDDSTDNDIIGSIRHFVEETKKQIKEEK